MMRRRVGSGERAAPAAVQIPHDVVNEQAVLVAALADADVRRKLTLQIKPDEFVVREHGVLWIALGEVAKRRLEPDLATLQQLTGDEKSARYAIELAGALGAPANLDHHVTAMRWDRARVEASTGPLAQLIELLRDPQTEPARVQSVAGQLAEVFRRGAAHELLRDPQALSAATRAERARRRERAVYPYGIDGLDYTEDGAVRVMPGCAPGKVTVVTGVPGSGKTTVAAQMALGQLRAGRTVLYGAWEIGAEAALEMLATLSVGQSRSKVLAAGITAEEEREIEAEEERLQADRRLYFVGRPKRVVGSHTARGVSAHNLRALEAVHAAIVETGAEVFVADLWKRMLTETRPEDEEAAFEVQQDVCQQTGCHGLLLQQQRFKDIESRPDKRPTREGIKGSGTYVEVADVIVGVHRPALWKNIADDTLELILLKQRWGGRATAIEFDWHGDTASLANPREVPLDDGVRGHDDADDFLAPRVGSPKRARKGAGR